MYSWEQRKRIYDLLAFLLMGKNNKVKDKKLQICTKAFNFTINDSNTLFSKFSKIRWCYNCATVIGILKEIINHNWIDIFGQKDYSYCPNCGK